MTRFISDQNKVVMRYESGTYAVPLATGKWVGEVTDHSLDDSEGYLTDYFLGDNSRSVGRYERGPSDATGTITYHPVDMNLIAHAIGSVYEASGTTFRHVTSEIGTDVIQNPFISGTTRDANTPYSFTIEDSKTAAGTGKNFVRTVKGCVIDSLTLTAAQGEKVVVEANYIGQGVDFSSGNTTNVTVADQRPYLWSDCALTMAGSSIDTTKELSIEINQNITGPHYLNGSRVIGEPFFGNREYALNVTADLDTDIGAMLYNQYYKGGSTLNWKLDMNADTTGSQHVTITVSGARITSMELPSVSEGINETTFVVNAGSMNLLDWVNPTVIGSYNPY
jgi:hypothetical protein